MYYLPSLLLPQRIKSLRSLRFKWTIKFPPLGSQEGYSIEYGEEEDRRLERWTTTWDNIASLQNLCDLHVKLDVLQSGWRNINEETADVLFRPIRKVVGPDSFVLTLPFPPMDTMYYYQTGREDVDDDTDLYADWDRPDPWNSLPCTIRRARIYL